MNDTQIPKIWLTAEEAASYMGVKVSFLYKYTSEKRIPYYKRGGLLRFKMNELDEFLEDGRVEPKGK